MIWPKGTRKWTTAEIISDVMLSREAFRSRRFEEPMDMYLAAFASLEKANKDLIVQLPRLFNEDPVDPIFIGNILKDENLKTALRYLGAPPISVDDLKTLTGGSLGWTVIQKDQEMASALRDVIVAILDPKRFPWVKMGRLPTPAELKAAVLASTVVASAQSVQTSRRTLEKNVLESSVRGILLGMGMNPVPCSKIESLRRDAPKPGEYTKSACILGADEADIVVGLYDHRVLAIECKGSNSAVNSRKRVNKEVVKNAGAWYQKFGEDELVAAAAIQGVFKPSYIEEAQVDGIVFFWGHRLGDLRDFILSTKP